MLIEVGVRDQQKKDLLALELLESPEVVWFLFLPRVPDPLSIWSHLRILPKSPPFLFQWDERVV